MKTEYNIKDQVWIHIGERSLREGRIVEIFDLSHLDEGVSTELYVVEINTPIEPVYEVRTFEQISPDATGPIKLFRDTTAYRSGRLFKRMGMPLPEGASEPDEEVAESEVKTKPRRKFYKSKK